MPQKQRNKRRDSFSFRGRSFYLPLPVYAPVLVPIVWLKRLLETLYHTLMQLMWAELVKGKKTAASLMSLVLFLIFCGLSLLAYWSRGYSLLITASFFALWLVDRYVTQRQLQRGAMGAIALEEQGNWVLWTKALPNGRSQIAKFQPSEVARVVIQRIVLRGGVFYDRLALVWRVGVVLCDATGYTIDETDRLLEAIETAEPLAAHFQVPLLIADSEGQGRYATAALNLEAFGHKAQFPKTIQVQRSGDRWQICAQWRAISFWLLGRQLVQEFGFLVFVLLMSVFMVGFGQWLALLLFSQPPTGVPQLNWQLAIGAVVSLALILARAAQLSREEHLTINGQTLSFRLNHRPIAEVAVESIVATLFLKQPFLALLILTPDRVIEINELQQEVEFRAMLLAIDEAIGYQGGDRLG